MGIHTGEPCFACGKTFLEHDDVVVCPDCGTPYHRECWKAKGACINLSLHDSGESWKSVRQQEEPQPERICPNCGTGNPQGEERCRNCGVPLERTDASAFGQTQNQDAPQPERESLMERLRQTAVQMGMDDPYCGMNQDDVVGGERLGDTADFVRDNTLYYLPKFRRFHEGHRISLNFPCLLFPQFYFANRKMWGFAMILVGVFSLLRLPQMAMAFQTMLPEVITMLKESQDTVMLPMVQTMLERLDLYENAITNAALICNYLDFCLTLVFCLFGNRLYYQFVLRRVHRIRQEELSPAMRRMRLRKDGGTNPWLVVGMIGLEYAFMAILSAVLFCLLIL